MEGFLIDVLLGWLMLGDLDYSHKDAQSGAFARCVGVGDVSCNNNNNCNDDADADGGDNVSGGVIGDPDLTVIIILW